MRLKRTRTALLLVATGAALAPGAAGAATVSCRSYSFTPGTTLASSSYGVGRLKARNTSCATAKSVSRGVLNARNGRFSKSGFACRRTGTVAHHVHNWRCTRSVRRVLRVVTFRSYGAG